MSEKMQTTYSMWSKFRNCRKACEWRYLQHLAPLERDHNLAFGSVIHGCLEYWHQHQDLNLVIAFIDRTYPERAGDEKQCADWHLATAMMTGYANRYPGEDFEVVALEKTFEGNIINPATGASSRSFTLAGRVDGIVRQDGKYFLLEHKTASQIDSGYLERLWTDFQIHLYAWYVEKALGWRISGVIYNILAKTKLRQRQGETEAVLARIPADVPVILDAKRGDIASTADAYARAAFDWLGAGALTVNPYLGADGVTPFLAREDRGVFVLCKTSNPSAGEVQDWAQGGVPLYRHIAERARAWAGGREIGLVMGATYPEAVAEIRAASQETWFLVPGVGVQGGDLEAALGAGLRDDGLGVLINSSRGILYADDPRAAAVALRDEINAVRDGLLGAPREAGSDARARRLARQHRLACTGGSRTAPGLYRQHPAGRSAQGG